MRARQGFTLVELVVVILVVGIIAAVAAPKIFDTAGEASLNTAKQDLAVIRDAIELHRAQNGAYPGQTGTQGDFNNDLIPLLRAKIKKCPVGNSSASVRVESSGLPLVVSGGQGWAYDNQTGQFIINHADYSDL